MLHFLLKGENKMRKIEDYMILQRHSAIDLSKEVLIWTKKYGYEIFGGAFWNGIEYCQTIVKYSN